MLKIKEKASPEKTKFDKWFEPAQQKQTKALPVPLEAPRKKRGGRRARKMKERLGMTDMRKYANRMNFGEIGDDVDQSDLGVDLGQLQTKGASGSGKVIFYRKIISASFISFEMSTGVTVT